MFQQVDNIIGFQPIKSLIADTEGDCNYITHGIEKLNMNDQDNQNFHTMPNQTVKNVLPTWNFEDVHQSAAKPTSSDFDFSFSDDDRKTSTDYVPVTMNSNWTFQSQENNQIQQTKVSNTVSASKFLASETDNLNVRLNLLACDPAAAGAAVVGAIDNGKPWQQQQSSSLTFFGGDSGSGGGGGDINVGPGHGVDAVQDVQFTLPQHVLKMPLAARWNSISHPEFTKIPEFNLQCKVKPLKHQIEGISYALLERERKECHGIHGTLIAWEMGLGKSLYGLCLAFSGKI
jgi:hypothetical protein